MLAPHIRRLRVDGTSVVVQRRAKENVLAASDSSSIGPEIVAAGVVYMSSRTALTLLAREADPHAACLRQLTVVF